MKRMRWRFFQSFILATAIGLAGAAHAQVKEVPIPPRINEDHKGIYSFSLENDIFAGSDNDYSNGARISYFSPEGDVPGFLEKAAETFPMFDASGHKRWGLAIGQSMFTPDNIATSAAQPDDEPYAGWTYVTAGLTSDTDRTLDTFEITLGMVGPASYAEDTQKLIHRLTGSQHPNGWQYQLRNEPGIILAYQRKWRNFYRFSPDGWGFDVTPAVGGEVGNIYTDASAGAVARFGHNLPRDYGPPLIRPSVSGADFFVPTPGLGWYLFTGIEGRAVARNIFLDGNTFESSPSVNKLPLVGGVQAGFAVTYGDTRISYTHVLRSQEFTSQHHLNQYGALTLSVRY